MVLPRVSVESGLSQTFHQFHDLYTELDLHRIMSGFHGAFATGVASQQGTLTLPDTWFRPPFWDLLMLQLLRPNSSNLPCLYSTFHLEYPLVLSRFSLLTTFALILRCCRDSNCGYSIMAVTLRVVSKLLVTNLVARRCTASIFWMLFWACGSHTVAAYST